MLCYTSSILDRISIYMFLKARFSMYLGLFQLVLYVLVMTIFNINIMLNYEKLFPEPLIKLSSLTPLIYARVQTCLKSA